MNFLNLTLWIGIIYLLYYAGNLIADYTRETKHFSAIAPEIRKVVIPEFPENEIISFSAPIQDEGIPLEKFVQQAKNMSHSLNF